MNTALPEHPDAEALQAFAEGRLTDARTEFVSQHIELCDQCTATVETYAVDPDSLIVECEPASTALAPRSGIASVGSKPVSPTASVAATLEEDFERKEVIGTGGMGIVYRAWQPAVGRFVAVKYLNSALPPEDPRSAQAVTRFKREVLALGRVRHPNLVQIYTSGATHEGRLFYSMEFIRGANLSSIFRALTDQDGPQPDWESAVADANQQTCPSLPTPPETAGRFAADYATNVVRTIRQVALAVQCLHDAGIVHRDIKPANIMIAADDGRAVLTDLGLADLLDEHATRLTGTGLIAGSLPYISPEHFRDEQPAEAGDVYHLGAVLWEFLALRRLFSVDGRGSHAATINRIINDAPPAPRADDRQPVSDLDAITLKCLEKDPALRYPSANALVQDLDRFLEGKSVSAPRRSSATGSFQFLRKHRTLATWIAGLTPLPILLLAFLMTMSSGRNGDRSQSADVFPGAKVSTRGLVSHWSANGTGNAAIDVSGHERSGQLTGDTFRDAGATGSGRAFWFDGENDYIDCGRSGYWNFLHDGSPFSIAASIAPVSAEEDGGIVATNDEHTTTPGFQGVCMRLNGHSRVEFYIQGIGTTYPLRLKAEQQIPSNRFTPVAVTFDGHEGRIYIDGKVAAIDGAMGTFVENDASDALSIGSIGTAANGPNRQAFDFFEGGIDDVRIYNRVLSEAEVRTLARDG